MSRVIAPIRIFIERPKSFFKNANKDFFRQLFLYSSTLICFTFALYLYNSGKTTLFGGYLFAFALFGFWRPKILLSLFVFFMALKHREFAYTAMQLGEIPIYITEWVLLILLLSGLFKFKPLLNKNRRALITVFLFFCIGFILLVMTLPRWGLVPAIRDFAIVYYSLFALITIVHIRTKQEFKFLVGCFIAGTLPNLLAGLVNFLYGTLPLTKESKNYSLRSSFYNLTAVGFVLPFILNKKSVLSRVHTLYYLLVAIVVLLYSYSKSSMISLSLLTLLFFVINRKEFPKYVLPSLILLFVIPLFFTPEAKSFTFGTLFFSGTYSEDERRWILLGAMRDFTEYPYGIGFGGSIFGEHIKELIKSTGNLFELHNSYLTVLRRTGVEGFLAYLAIIATALYSSLTFYRHSPAWSFAKKATLGTMLAWLASSTFLFGHVALEGPFFGAPYWILVGLLFGCETIFEKDTERECVKITPEVPTVTQKPQVNLKKYN